MSGKNLAKVLSDGGLVTSDTTTMTASDERKMVSTGMVSYPAMFNVYSRSLP